MSRTGLLPMSHNLKPERLDFREALMALERIPDAADGTPEADRRVSLIEFVLENESTLPVN